MSNFIFSLMMNFIRFPMWMKIFFFLIFVFFVFTPVGWAVLIVCSLTGLFMAIIFLLLETIPDWLNKNWKWYKLEEKDED